MVAAIPHFACTSLDVSYYCTDQPLPPNPKPQTQNTKNLSSAPNPKSASLKIVVSVS